MKTEIQDLAWQCLPRYVREYVRKGYRETDKFRECDERCDSICYTYEGVFGHHNLTSDEEPPELLFVERQDIINRYKAILVQQDPKNFGFSDYLQGQKELLESMFAAKCIPDKEPSIQEEPKHKVGDIVRIRDSYYAEALWGKTGKIYSHHQDNVWYVEIDNTIYAALESDLQPYTEPEYRNLSQNIANCDKPEDNKLKDNMEEKELNLVELLKGCEGEEIYSPTFGVVKVTMANCNCIGVDPWNHNSKSFKPDGRYVDKADAIVSLFPSRALYEKYPLDPYSAWMEWRSERTPKRWRAEKYKDYFYITDKGEVLSHQECNGTVSDVRYNFGNYFRTKEESQQAAEAVKRTLEDFHKNNTEQ